MIFDVYPQCIVRKYCRKASSIDTAELLSMWPENLILGVKQVDKDPMSQGLGLEGLWLWECSLGRRLTRNRVGQHGLSSHKH